MLESKTVGPHKRSSLEKCRRSDFVGDHEAAHGLSEALPFVSHVAMARPEKDYLLVHHGDAVVSVKDLGMDLRTRISIIINGVLTRHGCPIVTIGDITKNLDEQKRINEVVKGLFPVLSQELTDAFDDYHTIEELLFNGATAIPFNASPMTLQNGVTFSLKETPTGGDQRYAPDEEYRRLRNTWFGAKIMPKLGPKLRAHILAEIAKRWQGKVYVPNSSYEWARTPCGHECLVNTYNAFDSRRGDNGPLVLNKDPDGSRIERMPFDEFKKRFPKLAVGTKVETFWERDLQACLEGYDEPNGHYGLDVFYNKDGRYFNAVWQSGMQRPDDTDACDTIVVGLVNPNGSRDHQAIKYADIHKQGEKPSQNLRSFSGRRRLPAKSQ